LEASGFLIKTIERMHSQVFVNHHDAEDLAGNKEGERD